MKQIIILIALVLFLSSCTTRKHLVYLQDVKSNNVDVRHPVSSTKYRLNIGDIVYVKIMSGNSEVNSIFSANDFTQNSYGQNITQATAYLNGFSIGDDGTVSLPVLETVYIEGLTIHEAQLAIQKKADQYLKKTTVIVKLLSFSINILGEVNNPGTKDVFQKDLNIFEALARAGDIKETGDKKNILLVRMENGQAVTYKIDLTKKDLFSQVSFEIRPNDIIIVQPLRLLAFRMNIPTYSILLTAVSAILLSANFLILNY